MPPSCSLVSAQGPSVVVTLPLFSTGSMRSPEAEEALRPQGVRQRAYGRCTQSIVERCLSLGLGHPFEFSWLEVSQTDVFHWFLSSWWEPAAQALPAVPFIYSRRARRKSTAAANYFWKNWRRAAHGLAANVVFQEE
jgi:hypothetical protein